MISETGHAIVMPMLVIQLVCDINKSINLCLFVAEYIYNIENNRILFYHYLLIRFYNRDAAKDRQEGHQVSHIPLQDRYTFNYLSIVQTTTKKKKQKTKHKKKSSVKIKSNLNNKANKQ